MDFTPLEKDMNIISALDDEPNDVGGLTATELKAKFDEGGNAIKDYLNNTVIPEVKAALGDKAGKDELQGLVLGQIPDGTITEDKLSEELKEQIGSMAPASDVFTKEETLRPETAELYGLSGEEAVPDDAFEAILEIMKNSIKNVGSTQNIKLFTSSQNWTAPGNLVEDAFVVCCGGGGGGGSAYSNTGSGVRNGGGGGGSGYVVIKAVKLKPSTSYPIRVGAGGSASSQGGATSFGTLCTASGGLPGGSANSSSAGAGGAGEAGGGGGGSITTSGGPGGAGSKGGGGGGVSGGTGGSSTNGGKGGNGGASRSGGHQGNASGYYSTPMALSPLISLGYYETAGTAGSGGSVASSGGEGGGGGGGAGALTGIGGDGGSGNSNGGGGGGGGGGFAGGSGLEGESSGCGGGGGGGFTSQNYGSGGDGGDVSSSGNAGTSGVCIVIYRLEG